MDTVEHMQEHCLVGECHVIVTEVSVEEASLANFAAPGYRDINCRRISRNFVFKLIILERLRILLLTPEINVVTTIALD